MKKFIAKSAFIILITLSLLVPLSGSTKPASATSKYAQETGQSCQACHGDSYAQLTPFGQAYRDNGYRWPGKAATLDKNEPKSGRAWLPLVFRFAHLLSAVSWIGAILFIHLIMSPKAVKRGIPLAEIKLAWVNIAILTITGIYLTFQRIESLANLTSTTFGKLLLIKLAFFGFMVLTATLVTFKLNKRLKVVDPSIPAPANLSLYNSDDLQRNNGENGRPAYVLFEGKIYDVTGSKMWKNGVHAKKHYAGTDLTGALAEAPHGDNVMSRFPVINEVGRAMGGTTTKHSPVQRFFLFLANANLIFGIVILFITVLWNWL